MRAGKAVADPRTILQPSPSAGPGLAGGAGSPEPRAGGLAPGALLNNIYQVTRFLARGGMGEVYEGVNVNTDERVAIKVMLPHLAADPKVQAMFRKEARILTELAHPALVRYRVLAQEPQLGLFYIVTEFIDGRSISDLMGQIRPSAAELAALTRRLAEGLAAAHALGAVHRDISPDNVLLPQGRLDQAKIIDFGIARESTMAHQTIIGDSFAGKLGYVAPEQFGDFGRQVGPWTDIYSLGLVVLALAAGRAPDMGVTLVEAVDRRREGVNLSSLPPALRPIFERMLAPDPQRRFQTMDQLIEALDGIVTGYGRKTIAPTSAAPAPLSPLPPAAPTPSATPAAAKGSPKPWLYGAGAAALLAAAGLGFVLIGGGRPAQAPAAVAPAVAQPVEAAPLANAVEATLEPVQAPQPAPQPAKPTPPPRAAKPVRPVAQAAAPAPVVPPPVAAPVTPTPEPEAQPSPAAPVASAQPEKGTEACWQAVGASWAFKGYASRPSCVGLVFGGSCETVHGRWGKQQLRRYDGAVQAKGGGLLARWTKLEASSCASSATPEPGQ